MPLRLRPRFRQAITVSLCLLSVYYFLFGALPSPSLPRDVDNNLEPAAVDPSVRDAYDRFGRLIVKLIKDHEPPVVSLTKVGSAGVKGFGDYKGVSLKRPDLVPIGTSEVDLMRKAHQSLTDKVSNVSLPYVNATRGIVSTAGGSTLPVFIISLRMLRRTGSTLPVELFIRAEEGHDKYLCEELLPTLNARCVILDDFVKQSKHGFKLEKYQYKIFSVLFSSFEEVLLLDADNFPVKDPEHVFDTEPFTSSGLLTWPDFWISTASAKFYKIQDTEIPPNNLRASTESGQVFVNKRTHAAALLVAAYYNYYGPTHFYPLLTQGGPGEGDKETFLAGAAATGATFYQVSEPVSILGYMQKGKLNGVAMLQHDPVDDYHGVPAPAPFTVHANFPKMDPNNLFGSESPVIDRLTGKHHRLWGNKSSTMKTFGKDVERAMWDETRRVACELGGVFTLWKAVPPSQATKGTCEEVENHIDLVFLAEESD